MKKLLLTTTMLVTVGACSTQSPAPVVGGLFGDDYRVVNEYPLSTPASALPSLAPVAQPNVEISTNVETQNTDSYRVATLQQIEPAAGPVHTVTLDTVAKPKEYGNYRMTHNRNYSSVNSAVENAQVAVSNLSAQPRTDIFSIQPAAGPVTVATATPEVPISVELQAVPESSVPISERFTLHEIKKHDTLESLARDYETSIQKIKEINEVSKNDSPFKEGELISMPLKGSGYTTQVSHAPVATSSLFAIEPAAGPTIVQPTAPVAPVAPTVTTNSTAQHTFARGDTFYNLSKRYGTTVATLQSLNGSLNPTNISIGQVINVPANAATVIKSDTMSKIEPAVGTTSALEFAKKSFNSPDVTLASHKVAKGDNLYRIGLKYNVSVLDLMAANDFDKPQDLKSGMTIKLPLISSQTAVVKQTTQINQVAARAKGMVWPAKGSLLSSFGQKGNGVTHTGVAIKLPENTPVIASEKGEVIYADNGLKSYGNLVLIRHSDGLVTAYAHNNDLKVQKGDNVQKGQTIALSGATGNVTTPQLHFEVRRNARAIDPTSVLPKI